MKKQKNKKVHPVLVLLTLTLIVMIVSSLGDLFKLESSY